MKKIIILIFCALIIALSFIKFDITANFGGGSAFIIKGAVKKETAVSYGGISKLRSSVKRVKIYNEKNEYACSLEMDGVSLQDVLALAQTEKKADDGFDRDLDMFVVVRGKNGKSALFSYGEIISAKDMNSITVTKSAKHIFPHKHSDLSQTGFDMNRWTRADGYSSLDTKNCASCHDGKEQKSVYFPEGFCLFAACDASNARFVENITEIEICQAPKMTLTPEKDKENMWCEKPTLIFSGKNTVEITIDGIKSLPKFGHTENTVGMGKGFHGKLAYGGYDMAQIIKNNMQDKTETAKMYVLVTAADGYRSLFSAGEIFDSLYGPNLFLADTENEKELQKGSGKFRIFIKSDFFVDRSIRSVKEISCEYYK
ncbi:MAG TPA: hypothetical protein PKW98_03220 [Candidatus Wallbacteria bacterium]|nr:MAG: hypothetical protein BWY32_00637 [bacterium ADurb.Bin243]HPG56807.1 hypothetical protein [Candidatus Wallbacteria bacterium]